jgi:hypothetical protein
MYDECTRAAIRAGSTWSGACSGGSGKQSEKRDASHHSKHRNALLEIDVLLLLARISFTSVHVCEKELAKRGLKTTIEQPMAKHATSQHITIRSHYCAAVHTTSQRVTPQHTTTSHHVARSRHITSHHITSHHITSHHITSHHITSHHTTPHQAITSHHLPPSHTTSHRLAALTQRQRSFRHLINKLPHFKELRVLLEIKLLE